MKRCRDAEPLLSAFAADELSVIEVFRVQGHLDLCHECKQKVAAFKSAHRVLSSAEPAMAPVSLRAAVLARTIDQPYQPSRRISLRWATALGTLGFAVAAGASVVHFGLLNTSKPVSVAVSPSIQSGLLKRDKTNSSNSSVVKVNSDTKIDSPALNEESNDNGKLDKAWDRHPDEPITVIKRREDRTNSGQALSRIDSFWDVRAADGFTAREKLALRNQGGGSITTSGHNGADPRSQHDSVRYETIPSAPNVRVVQDTAVDRPDGTSGAVQLRRETGYDAGGRIALIRVHTDKDADPIPADKQ